MRDRNERDQRAPAAPHARSEAGATVHGGTSAPRADGAAGGVGSLLPGVAMPRGGGAIRGIGEKFTTNPATGTASMSVPVAVTPGRPGFELDVELVYDSGAGNGPFGMGWRISVPSITRKTDKGLPRYDDGRGSDTFVLSGAEDLVPARTASGEPDALERTDGGEFHVERFRPRVQSAFARIERWTDRSGDVHWRATTRENVTSVYGRTPQARIIDPADPRRVFSWLLEETRDDAGHAVRYVYKGEDGAGVDPARASEASRFESRPDGARTFGAVAQRYLKRILYGNRRPHEASDWLFELVLDYGEHDAATPTPDDLAPWPVRPDAFSSYRAGFEVRTYRLCRRLLMFHRFAELGPEPCLVRSTELAYDAGPVTTYLTAVTHAGWKRDPATGAYERATLPALSLDYVRPVLNDEVRAMAREDLEGIPGGVDGSRARWVDLDGDGLPGVLAATPRAWRYKVNLGGGHLAPAVTLPALPSPAELAGGVQQLVDLGEDGRLELVQYSPPLAGWFSRTPAGGWDRFTAFPALPDVAWTDPNLRFVDLDGDGLADVLITRDDALVAYRSLGTGGFEPATLRAKPTDERAGPAVVFADGTETIQLADMSGDGLMDIVRVRSGELCYWPNLGHGRFGRKITMDRSPALDGPDAFDPGRVRFVDVDGSGTSDLLYVGRGGVRLYVNQSGNGFTEATALRSLPDVHALSSVGAVDLLGTGTACLVWSSAAPADEGRTLAYVDLMGGRKPHLLASISNGLGAETRIAYAASTAFSLRDRREGRPWLTRLPFPVHVVERIERYDLVARSRTVTRFRYHHGHFDGHEREFGGFALVEQWDAESFGGGVERALFPDAVEVEPELRQPPAHTKTWFHTGAWLDRDRLERALAAEYYDRGRAELPDTILPAGLSVREQREAARALRGSVLRQELYAEDDAPERAHPYSVSERSYGVRVLQRSRGEEHAVVTVLPAETVELRYERRPQDPRVQHDLVLDVDDFGNVTRAVSVAYPRRAPAHAEQARAWITVTESAFANRADEPAWYRIGAPVETATAELTGFAPPADGLFTAAAIREALAAATELSYEVKPSGVGAQRRVVARERTVYYREDLSGPLPLGEIASHGLVHTTYRRALTPGLVALAFGARVDDAMLRDEARYVLQDGAWWTPSGRVVFDPARFLLPVEAFDPFGARHGVRYDAYDLLVLESEDPLGNRVTAGLRDASGAIVRAGNDYRVLAPALVTDPNLNRFAVAFDALGLVVATATMGKIGATDGDTLEDPTTRLEYDLHRWRESGGKDPAVVHVRVRERHGPWATPRWEESWTYSDGSGREVMKKVQAEPGPVPMLGPDGRLVREADGTPRVRQADPRFVGSGRKVLDNKGNVVKRFEPYFSATFEYEDDAAVVEWGVTRVLRYDPVGRVVRTDQPDGTHTRASFDAWSQETWDENDTVEGTPWLARRQAGTPAERRAAALTLAHAGTPAVTHLDALGRVFLTVGDAGAAGTRETRIELDAAGNALSVTDPRGVRTLRRTFDMTRSALLAVSADAGESRVLRDAVGQELRTWDARGRALRHVCDALHRPTHLWVREGAAPERLLERLLYGEADPEPEARNLRTRQHQVHDGAGALTSTRYDVDGNLVEVTRRLARDVGPLDWAPVAAAARPLDAAEAAAPLLDAEAFTTTSAFDALGRLVSRTTPDGSELRPSYGEAGLLERVEARIGGDAAATAFVTDVDYDARGQRARVEHGNGAVTEYRYDPATFRLVRQTTTRPGGEVVQDLSYEYDAVGNVVQVADAVSFGNGGVTADGLYEYDALYQLVKAEGREHPGQQPAEGDPQLLRMDHPSDLQALRRYRETYAYDAAGNVERVAHLPLGGTSNGWTREYSYAADSNRLLATSVPGDPAGTFGATYAYDEHGNVARMPHLAELRWGPLDRLEYVDLAGGGDVHLAYDAGGGRVRKTWLHDGVVEDRVFLGGYEVYRRRPAAGGPPEIERQTLHVMDDRRRVALVETTTVDARAGATVPERLTRFQVENHLGSSTAELDDAGAVISYEEYHPYGTTAFRASGPLVAAAPKRYRYTGKERDEETGLYDFGARYYAAWLGRWTSPDPAGLADGPNAYEAVRNSPVVRTDPDGRWSWGKTLGIAAAVVVGVAATALTGGALGPVAAAVIGGMVAGATGEIVEAAVDRRPITAGNVVTAAAIGGLLGGAFAGAGALLARSQVVKQVVARVAGSGVGQAVGRAVYRAVTSRSTVANAGHAVAGAARRGVEALERVGEGAGRRLGGWFAQNAERQAGMRAGLQSAGERAADKAGGGGVAAAVEGEVGGSRVAAATRSGADKSGTGARAIETPQGRVRAPTPDEVAPELSPKPVPFRSGDVEPRGFDAEFKLFGFTLKTTAPDATGRLFLGVTAPMCPSCAANAWALRAARPGLELITEPASHSAGAAGALGPLLAPDDRQAPPPMLQMTVSF